MLGLNDFQTWLTANSIPNPLINRMPETPVEAVVFQTVGSLAQIMDGAFDVQTVQIRARASTDVQAETDATAIFELIKSNQGSQHMGSTYVLYIEPMGGPVYYDRDQEQRTTYAFSCSIATAA